MSQIVLREIERLLELSEKATPGPWIRVADEGDHISFCRDTVDDHRCVGGCLRVDEDGPDNADAICGLRNRAPALLRLLAAMLEERRSRQARGLWNISGWECGHGTPCGAACKECVAGPVYCADEDMATAVAAIKEAQR